MDPSKPSGHVHRGHGHTHARGLPSTQPPAHGNTLPALLPSHPVEPIREPDFAPAPAPAPPTSSIPPPFEAMDIDTEPMPPTPTVEPSIPLQNPNLPFPANIDPESTAVDDDEFNGDGLGFEEADEEDVSLHSSSSTFTTPHHLSVPAYVTEAFDSHKSSYLDCDPNNFPKLYNSHKSFWVPQASPLLQNWNRLSQLAPQSYYCPRFFVWDFLPFVNQMACPKDQCGGSLVRRGNRERPRRVVDLNDCYWLMGTRYQCNSCDTLSEMS